MQIGRSMEKTPPTTAMENMANRLADKVRNLWMDNQARGLDAWEETFFEDADGISFLRDESFPNLQGIDYILKWWGSQDLEGLSGVLEVLWKVAGDNGMEIYKTWIRFAERDFKLGEYANEARRREINRSGFREAFAVWQQLYLKHAANE